MLEDRLHRGKQEDVNVPQLKENAGTVSSPGMCREVFGDLPAELFDRERFAHESVSPSCQSLASIFRHRLRTDDNRWDIGPCGRRTNLAHEADPVEFGHHNIRENQIRRTALEQPQRLVNVIRQMDLITVGSQEFMHDRAKHGIIIDNEHDRITLMLHGFRTSTR
jgi:hypothetical protein